MERERCGIHAPNVLFTPEIKRSMGRVGYRAVKLMPYHTREEVLDLQREGVEHFLMRLPDPVADDGRIKNSAEWGLECIRVIRGVFPLVRKFQLGNEENLTFPEVIGWAPNMRPSEVFAWLLEQTAPMIMAAIGPGVELVMPPVSFGQIDPYLRGPDGKVLIGGDGEIRKNPRYAWTWVEDLRRVIPLFPEVGVNAYWQSQDGDEMLWGIFGGVVAEVWKRYGRPIVVTEWGNSLGDRTNPPAPDWPVIEACMEDQYPRYVDWLCSLPYVREAYAFIGEGCTERWRDFRVTEKVGGVMLAGRNEKVLGRGEHLI
jgi:hypothetical protein